MTEYHTTIPPTLAKAKKELAGLDALLQAKEWARAAIVYAYTRDDDRGGGSPEHRAEVRGAKPLTFRAFAELGITGLSASDSVARYHRAWAGEVEAGRAQPAAPGSEVKLPSTPWPPNAVQLSAGPAAAERAEAVAEAAGVGVGNVAQVLKNPGAVRAAILHDPKVRELAVEALAEVARTPEGASAGVDAAARIGSGYREGAGERRAVRQEHQPENDLSRAARGAHEGAQDAADALDDVILFGEITDKLRAKARALRAQPPRDEEDRLALLDYASQVREALGELLSALEPAFNVPDSPPLS